MELSSVRFGNYLSPRQQFENGMRLGRESRIAAANHPEDFQHHALNSLQGFEEALNIVGHQLKLNA